MLDWLHQNVEWVFSGIGVLAITLVANKFFFRNGQTSAPSINISNTNLTEIQGPQLPQAKKPRSGVDMKQNVRILFVDDDTKFQVVKILKNDGWHHVKIVKDISSLTSPELLEANILFVDIQGVGKALSFSDEGLGLAYAIKQKYPDKKVIIYSAQTTGERFHRGLQNADYFLPKNADPYEFIKLAEDFSETSE